MPLSIAPNVNGSCDLKLGNTTTMTFDSGGRTILPAATVENQAVNTASYATSTLGGTVKVRLDGTNLYITTNGSNA